MSSLKEEIVQILVNTYLAGNVDDNETEVIETALATLQTAVLAAAPEKYHGSWFSEDPVMQGMYEEVWKDAVTEYTKALQQLFESEQL